MPKHIVAAADEILPGDRKIVEIAGRSIGVFNLDGEFFGLRNRCPHQGGPLCLGKQGGFISSSLPGEYEYSRRGEILKCPWHGWEFDLRTGQSWFDPQRVRVRQYDVTVAPAGALVAEEAPAPGLERGPYVAETYPVSVEQHYLVIDLPD